MIILKLHRHPKFSYCVRRTRNSNELFPSFCNLLVGRKPSRDHPVDQRKPSTNTVELKLLELLWDYENMFETGVVRANDCLSKNQNRMQSRDIFSISLNMKVYFVFSLESPHRGDSNEYT